MTRVFEFIAYYKQKNMCYKLAWQPTINSISVTAENSWWITFRKLGAYECRGKRITVISFGEQVIKLCYLSIGSKDNM